MYYREQPLLYSIQYWKRTDLFSVGPVVWSSVLGQHNEQLNQTQGSVQTGHCASEVLQVLKSVPDNIKHHVEMVTSHIVHKQQVRRMCTDAPTCWADPGSNRSRPPSVGRPGHPERSSVEHDALDQKIQPWMNSRWSKMVRTFCSCQESQLATNYFVLTSWT